MNLINQSKQVTIAAVVEEARTFRSRLVGLLGRDSLQADHTLWFDHCNSIHTCFMRFAIDVVFVDKNLKVRKVVRNLKPWRLVLPVFGAQSTFEFAAGAVSLEKVSVGDQLHVGH